MSSPLVITTRRKCTMCNRWMEVGEPFEFMEFFFGATLPVHPIHKYPLEGLAKELKAKWRKERADAKSQESSSSSTTAPTGSDDV